MSGFFDIFNRSINLLHKSHQTGFYIWHTVSTTSSQNLRDFFYGE